MYLYGKMYNSLSEDPVLKSEVYLNSRFCARVNHCKSAFKNIYGRDVNFQAKQFIFLKKATSFQILV